MKSNLHQHARNELDVLLRNNPDDELLITPFIPQVLALVDAFGESGQSGGSAPSTAGVICSVLKKLLAWKPLSPLTGEDSEWNDVSDMSGETCFQNKRCSCVFKGATGVAYTIEGYVFWHWSERSLAEDEEGYPGTDRYKSYFSGWASIKLVEFPYTIPDRIEVEVECYEVNKETGECEPGSGWWHTVFPEWLLKENAELREKLGRKP